MKTIKLLAAVAVVCASVACSSNSGAQDPATGETVNPKTLLPSKGLTDSTSYLIGINFGSFIKQYNFGENLNFAQIEKGINDFIKAKGSAYDPEFGDQFKINPEAMNDVFNEYLTKMGDYTKAVNQKKEKDFLAANAKKEGFETTPSGLQYLIIEPGNDNKPGEQDTVFVHYKGTLPDGTVFDECPEDRASIMLTPGGVIEGWKEGLQLIGEGGKATLVIPSELGYGETGAGGVIPPCTPLVFDLQIDSLRRFVPKAE